MTSEVRVILVGRTGLDAKLRLDPSVELIRVKDPIQAIGELSDPLDSASPRASVVVVGADADPALTQTNGADDHATEFVRGLRMVDPSVRVLRVLSETPGSERVHEAYDGSIGTDASAESLRAVIRGVSDRQGVISEPPMPPVPSVRKGVEVPTPRPAGSRPAREACTIHSPGVPGDTAVVQAMLRGGDALACCMELLRARLGDQSLAFVPAAAEVRTPGAGVPVEFDDRTYGTLSSSVRPAHELTAHATWLASWLRLSDQQSQLREAAFTDSLTGAWNRRYFDKFLSASLDRARTLRQTVTILLFDIDDFKQYNESYGHQAADEILIETVRLLRAVVRPTDKVCRIGGDEFAVIFHEPQGPRVPGSHPPTSIFQLASRFQDQIRQQKFPKLGIDAPGRLTISGGLASFPWDGATPDELVRKADTLAMESKQRGKNAITFGPGAVQANGDAH